MTSDLPGRADDLAKIRAFLDDIGGSGGSLLLTGDPGSGKSALLDTAAEYARGRGLRVLRVAGTAYPGTAPYAALDELVAPVRTVFGELEPVDRAALSITLGLAEGAHPNELAVAHALVRLLQAVGREQPVAVFVDHGQDLDDASARIFALAARRPRNGRVAILLASRNPWPHGLLHHAGLVEHRLAKLGDDAAAELLENRFPDLAAAARGRVIGESAGNPLAMIEYAAALTPGQRAGVEALPAVLPIGEHGRARTAAHFAGLPDATRHVLLLAALEDTGDLTILQAATPGTDAVEAALPAERRQYIRIDMAQRRICFLHPMLRSAFLENATKLEHRRAHRALASALDTNPDRQVVHLAAAAVRPDADLAGKLRHRAEMAIRRGDAKTAGVLLTWAGELSVAPAARSRRLLEAAAIRADVTGHLADATHMLELATGPGTELADSLPAAVAAGYLALNGLTAVDATHRLLVAAVEAYPRRWDAGDEMLVEALHLLLMHCWASGKQELWGPFERALARLRPALPARLGMCVQAVGDPVRMDHSLLPAIEEAAGRLSHEHNPIAITRTALACVYLDRIALCLDALSRVIRDGERRGAAALAINATIPTCHHLWHSGQWNELATLAADGLARCDRFGYARYRMILAGYHLPLVAVARGDTRAGLDAVDRTVEDMSAQGVGLSAQFAHHVRALAAIGRGDFGEAYEQACAISPAGSFAPHTPQALWVMLELVEGATRSGRQAPARAHVKAMEAAGIANLSPRLALCVAGCAAMVADTSESYEKALAVRDADRWPFDQGRIRLAYGEHLRRKRRTDAARIQLTAALQIFQRLDARPWIARTSTALRAVGRSTAHTADDHEILSAQERRIAELAAAGLSNREIGDRLHLSHRTVSSHLYRVFPKLGVTSRAALRDALREQSR